MLQIGSQSTGPWAALPSRKPSEFRAVQIEHNQQSESGFDDSIEVILPIQVSNLLVLSAGWRIDSRSAGTSGCLPR